MRTIADLGEFGLIDRIQRAAARQAHGQVVLGIGDDAALLRPRRAEDLVVSADTLVEHVHFRFTTQAASTIGRRALAVNLSDLAAMGARPLAFTLAMAAPPKLALSTVDSLLGGLLKAATSFSCPLVGGNLAVASETSLAITVLGAVKRGRELRRHRVRANDRLFVTGTLGAASLALARAERLGTRLTRLPEPRLAAGLALGKLGRRVACIDLSDGLVADLGHLLAGSGLGAELDPTRLPLPRGFAAGCRKLGLDPQRQALSGGEDYELLFALGGRDRPSQAALGRRLGVAVTEIGRVTAHPGLAGVDASSAPGWRHF